MTRNDVNGVLKLLVSPKLRPSTIRMLGEYQKEAMTAGDAAAVTMYGNAMDAIGKLDKAKPDESALSPGEPATLPANNEAEPEGGRRRSRS